MEASPSKGVVVKRSMAKVPSGWRSMARCSAERELSRSGHAALIGRRQPEGSPGRQGPWGSGNSSRWVRRTPLQRAEKVVEAMVFQHYLHDVVDRRWRRAERKGGDGGGRGRKWRPVRPDGECRPGQDYPG